MSNINNIIREAIDAEKRIKALTNELCEKIEHRIENERMDGVEEIGNNCFTVKSSAIFGKKEFILCPYYYSQKEQAKLVKRALCNSSQNDGIQGFVHKISLMAEKEQVIIGNEKYRLNEKTVGVLKEALSSIGENASSN